MGQSQDDKAAANKFHADTARANELFVEAAKLVSSAENACPSSKDLRQLGTFDKGGSGSSLVMI